MTQFIECSSEWAGLLEVVGKGHKLSFGGRQQDLGHYMTIYIDGPVEDEIRSGGEVVVSHSS